MVHCRSTAEGRNKKEALDTLGHQFLQVIFLPLKRERSAWEACLLAVGHTAIGISLLENFFEYHLLSESLSHLASDTP